MSDNPAAAPPGGTHSEDEIVAAFGYQQQLRRGLGLFSLFAVSFSVISITTGIYTNFGFAITNFGPAAIWLWIPAVVGQLIVALILAELGSRIPLAGGPYQWAGRLLGPGFGFFVAIGILMAFTVASGGEVLLVIPPLVAWILGLDSGHSALVVLVALAIPDLKKTAADPAPIAYIATYWLGPVVSRIFLIAVVYSVFALIVVSIAAVGRTFFALSRDKVLPGSGLLARVNPRSQTPVPAIILSTLLMIVVMVLAAVRGDAYVLLITSTPILVFMNNLIVVV